MGLFSKSKKESKTQSSNNSSIVIIDDSDSFEKSSVAPPAASSNQTPDKPKKDETQKAEKEKKKNKKESKKEEEERERQKRLEEMRKQKEEEEAEKIRKIQQYEEEEKFRKQREEEEVAQFIAQDKKRIEEEEEKRKEAFIKKQLEEEALLKAEENELSQMAEDERLEFEKMIEERKKKEEELKASKETERREKEKRLRSMRGFLVKQGHVVKSWKSRYFIIEDGSMMYYTDSNLQCLKGTIPLRHSVASPLDYNVDGKENCFQVDTETKRTFLLSTSTPTDRAEWLEAIRFISSGVLALSSDRKSIEDPNKEELDDLEIRIARASMKAKGERIAKSGWLFKEGHVMRNWKKRWFVLNASRLTESISYFSDMELTDKKGEINLRGGIVDNIDIKGRKHSFVIKTKTIEDCEVNKDFLLCAESDEERDQWVKAVVAAVKAIEDEKSFVNILSSSVDK